MAQTNQVIDLLTVVPVTLMLYDYAITLDNEIKYIWNRSMSMVNLIYFTLRYVGIIFALYYAGALLWDWNTSNEDQFYSFTLRLLQIWPLSIGTWLVHIILQMRVYILHDRSRRILFIVVLGFIIEVAVSLVTMIRVSIFQANNAVNQTATIPAAFPASETIDIYVNNAVSLFYEFLLFSLALWATVRCSRCPLAANQTGARNLRVVLIEGNVMYFLATLLQMLAYLIVSLTLPYQTVYVTTNVSCALLAILGCQIILHIRSVASQQFTGTGCASVSQHDSKYSIILP